MANNNLGNFAGGFADAFSRIYFPMVQQQNLNQQNKALKDLQLKKIKADLELAEQQANARNTLLSQISPGEGPPRPLADVLATDPGLLIQSGSLDTKDLLREQRLGKGQALFEQALSNFSGGAGEQSDTEQPGGGANLFENADPLSVLAASQSGDLSKLSPRRMKTATIQTPEGPAVVQFPENNPTEQTVIGPAKEEKISGQEAGRLSSLKQSSDIVDQFRKDYINSSGELTLSETDLFNISFNTPKTKGRIIRQQFRDAIDAVIRARTGAAAPMGEMKSLLDQFMPDIFDSPAGRIDKINRLESFVNGTLDIATLPKSVQEKIRKHESDSDIDNRIKALEKKLGQ